MKKYAEKQFDLYGDRKLVNAVKKAGLETINPQGGFNGYGYDRMRTHVVIKSVGDMRKFNRIKKELAEREAPAVKTPEEKKMDWAKRLAKLGEISIEEALEIADDKLGYQIDRINALKERNNERLSHKRDVLIRKIERENPLRRITGLEHAYAILAAHRRHTNTNYEYMLAQARYLSERGEIDRSEVRDYARENLTAYPQISEDGDTDE